MRGPQVRFCERRGGATCRAYSTDASESLATAGGGRWSAKRKVSVILELLRGNADEALTLVRESLTLYRQLQDKYAIVYVMVPLAAAAVLKGEDLWAARILGARDAVTERTGATIADRWVHALGEQAEWEVRGRLGPDRWARAHAAGRVTSIDAWIRDINGVLRRSAAVV